MKAETNGRMTLASIVISIGTLCAGAWLLYLSTSVVDMTGELAQFREFKDRGPRFSAYDAVTAHKILRDEILKELRTGIPPKWLVDRLDAVLEEDERMAKEQLNLQAQINKWERLLDAHLTRCER